MPITDRYLLSEIWVSIIDIGPYSIGSGRGAFNNNLAWLSQLASLLQAGLLKVCFAPLVIR